MTEIWKDISGYEGIYEVSSLGRVRTHNDKVTESVLHGTRHWKQRINHAFDNGLIKTGTDVILVDKKTQEMHRFRSLAKASQFLGRNQGYLSNLLLNSQTLSGFEVFIKAKGEEK